MNQTELKQLLHDPTDGCEHIYLMDAKVIEDLKPNELQ